MADLKTILFVLLGIVTAWFVVIWAKRFRQTSASEIQREQQQTLFHAVVGFVFTFFDVLGIGNFAPTTSAFKFRGSVPDERIPGTLNVGYAIPTIASAYIFIAKVEVDPSTLVSMIVAAVLGAWLGAGIVSRWSRRTIQVGMGTALLAAGVLMVLKQFEIGPAGGTALSLEGQRLGVGLAVNCLLGALMTLGIGLYGPCLILVSLLGMDPLAAFPIMMGSCAFLMPVGGARFVRAGGYCARTALVLTLCGLPAVLIATSLVTNLPLEYVRWLVVIVVFCAATMMLRSAWTERRKTT